LANPPLVSQQFNVILNILSPANYDAFHRLLCEGGIVIKVIPNRYYLRELREALWEGSGRSFSNDRTMQLFKEHFEPTRVQRVRYTYPLEPGQVQPLLAMTPLAWRADDSKLNHFAAHPPTEITVDLTVMIGNKR
jgi:23S rRNA (guanine745-N1)-methyltransferase